MIPTPQTALFLALCACACSDTAAVIRVPVEGASALVIVALAADLPPRIEAVALPAHDPPAFVTFPRGKSRALTVHVLRWPCPLADLDLAPGSHQPAASGDAIPPGASVSSATLAAGETTPTFVPATAPIPELDALRLVPVEPAGARCAAFDPAYVTLETRGDDEIGFAVSLGPDSALAVSRYGRFFQIDRGRDARRLWTNVSTATPHRAGFQDPSGDVWLAGERGELVRGTPTKGFIAQPPLLGIAGDPAIALGGSGPGAPLELFAATSSGSLQRFSGGGWTVLDQRARGFPDAPLSIAWTAPGEAFAAGLGDGLLHVVRGQVTTEALPGGVARALAMIPGVGLVAGTTTGELWLRAGAGWQALPGSRTGDAVSALAPLDRGLLIGRERGELGQWDAFYGLCPVIAGSPSSVLGMLAVDSGFLVVTAHAAADHLTIYDLRRTTPKKKLACSGP